MSLTEPEIKHLFISSQQENRNQTTESIQQLGAEINPTPKSVTTSNNLRNRHIQQALQRYTPQNPSYSYMNLKNLNGTRLKIYKDCAYWGQFLNGTRNGMGLILYDSGRIYEGEIVNDRKHGRGCEILPDGAIYEGSFVNGKPEGMGKFTWSNGESYDGEWLNGLKHGQGVWTGKQGDTYLGDWKCGKADGYGVHIWINGDKYEGQFTNCLKHGEGKEYFANGDLYCGAYINGKPEGYGEYYWANKTYFKGIFKNGLRHGLGFWQRNEEETYEGEYVNDKKCGYGLYKWGNGNFYRGNFFDDLRHGYGEMFWEDGSYYKGIWELGYQHGEGEIKTNNGEVKIGRFEKNQLVQEREDDSDQLINNKEQMQIKIRLYTRENKYQTQNLANDNHTNSQMMPQSQNYSSLMHRNNSYRQNNYTKTPQDPDKENDKPNIKIRPKIPTPSDIQKNRRVSRAISLDQNKNIGRNTSGNNQSLFVIKRSRANVRPNTTGINNVSGKSLQKPVNQIKQKSFIGSDIEF